MPSMKFPHLFLPPEIIITFLWGWEWSGGQVRHRSPRNSGYQGKGGGGGGGGGCVCVKRQGAGVFSFD